MPESTEVPDPAIPAEPVRPVVSPCEWHARPVRFAFQFGEIALGSVLLPTLTLSTHFLRLVGGAPEPGLPFETFPAGTSLALANSYPVTGPLPRLAVLPRTIRYVPSQYRHYYVGLTGTFDVYLGKLSSKSRWTLRKKVRKFAEFSGGVADWREYRPGSMDEFHRFAFAVSEKTFQARLLGSGLPGIEEFRRRVARLDDARGYVLFHGELPVAYIFCPVDDGNLLYDFVGYDPDYQQWSPGTVLQYLALESLFAEGRYRAFDFTEGEADHKRFFADQSVLCADIFYFRKTLVNFLIVGLHAGLRSAASWSGRFLGRVGLKSRLKKLIRAKA